MAMHENLQNFIPPNLLAIVVSICIGLIYGLEREVNALPRYRDLTGIRTLPLLAALGCIVTIIGQQTNYWIIAAATAGVFLLTNIIYFTKPKDDSLEIKQEVIIMLVFASGILTGLHMFREALVMTVASVTILSFKEQLHFYLNQVNKIELSAFIKFAILFVIVLPFVPDANYGPEGIVNPREIAWVVLVVSLLGFAGYILMKFGRPEKGILFTALLGGLFSSTAVTWIYSAKSKEQNTIAHLYSCGILLACTVMFGRILFFAYLFSLPLFKELLVPCLSMIFVLITATGIMLWKKRTAPATIRLPAGSPMELTNALVFGLVYVAVMLMVYYANKFWSTTGLYLSGAISGLSAVDAITINMAKLSGKSYSIKAAASVIILASLSNNLVKLGISVVKGDRLLRKIYQFRWF